MFVDMYDKKILGKLHKFQKEYKTTIVLHVVKNEAKFVDVSKTRDMVKTQSTLCRKIFVNVNVFQI